MAIVHKSGFDCEFVEKPPEALQSKCPICELILREPYQAPCCGSSFCQVCIKKIKTENKPCPTCKEENVTVFHNKGLQYPLYKFQVYCSNKQEGCEWKGELGQLDNHLNLSPQPDKQLEGCEYIEIECIYCSELTKRSNITAHQNDLCFRRPFSCEYCSYKSNYEDVIRNHRPVCGYRPVQCPNECGTPLQHQDLENHVTKKCPNIHINCDFHHVGCDVSLPVKDMPAHLEADFITHLSLQAASYKELQEKVNKLESENESLKCQIEEMQGKSEQSPTELQEVTQKNDPLREDSEDDFTATSITEKRFTVQILAYMNKLTMENFEQHKRDGSTWYSPPFYSRPRGYKLCLRVDANGVNDGKGTHVSVFIYLMKGKYDDELTWPFKGGVTVQLQNQEGNGKSETILTEAKESTHTTYNYRVTEGEMNENGWGLSKFITHRQLKTGYLKNNCLYFCITCKQ